MRILVVDDNPLSRKLMHEMLEQYGDCETAEDGLTAVQLFRDHLQSTSGFELVCLDIMIPGLNGQQVLKQIRELEDEKNLKKKAKVIMCTSLDDSDNIMEAFTRGQCDAYITKPISREKLHYHLQEIGLA
jgi:two-component system, chemotaxis family, chemotaxis protein CheY